MNEQRKRRPVVIALIVVAVVAISAAAIAIIRHDRDSYESKPASFDAKSGQPFSEPKSISSHDGLLQTTLEVQESAVAIAGATVKARVYNGQWPGPTLHVRPGDTIKIALVNDLDQETNLHTHGFHVSPAGISDNVLRTFGPGERAPIEIHIPRDIAVGTYWYHAHLHGLTETQVFGGLSGVLIVDGLEQKLPASLRGIRQRVLALKDLQVKDGAILSGGAINSDSPTTRTVNGLVRPRISIRPGETQLWRLANIGADIWYRLKLKGVTFHVIAEDANPVWNVAGRRELLLPPGKRYDVLVQGPPAGRYELETLAYSTGPTGDSYPQRTLAALTSTGAPEQPAQIPESVIKPLGLDHEPVDERQTVVFSENTKTNQFYINGTQFNSGKVNLFARIGEVQEWTIKNTADEQHPFHIHVNDFQVMSVNGRPNHANSLQDVVPLPIHGQVVVRMKFTDFTGRTVFHCHILNHEDRGMMSILQINPRHGSLPKSQLTPPGGSADQMQM